MSNQHALLAYEKVACTGNGNLILCSLLVRHVADANCDHTEFRRLLLRPVPYFGMLGKMPCQGTICLAESSLVDVR